MSRRTHRRRSDAVGDLRDRSKTLASSAATSAPAATYSGASTHTTNDGESADAVCRAAAAVAPMFDLGPPCVIEFPSRRDRERFLSGEVHELSRVCSDAEWQALRDEGNAKASMASRPSAQAAPSVVPFRVAPVATVYTLDEEVCPADMRNVWTSFDWEYVAALGRLPCGLPQGLLPYGLPQALLPQGPLA